MDLSNLTKEQIQEEINRCKRSPAYYYNTYYRKEGEPLVSEKDFNDTFRKVDIALKGRKGNMIIGVKKERRPRVEIELSL